MRLGVKACQVNLRMRVWTGGIGVRHHRLGFEAPVLQHSDDFRRKRLDRRLRDAGRERLRVGEDRLDVLVACHHPVIELGARRTRARNRRARLQKGYGSARYGSTNGSNSRPIPVTGHRLASARRLASSSISMVYPQVKRGFSSHALARPAGYGCSVVASPAQPIYTLANLSGELDSSFDVALLSDEPPSSETRRLRLASDRSARSSEGSVVSSSLLLYHSPILSCTRRSNHARNCHFRREEPASSTSSTSTSQASRSAICACRSRVTEAPGRRSRSRSLS